MKFIRKLINSKKTYTIVDIGTYKIRCNIVEISKDSIKILGYGEKKQEPGDFYFGELQNLENIAKNL
jgi:cell division ATPase FtsA